MKILIVTGHALGHVGRSLIVAVALREISPGEIYFTGINPSGQLERYVSPYGFKIVSLGDSPRLSSSLYAYQLENALRSIKPDVIVFDISPVPWLTHLKLPHIPQAYITNYFLTKLGRHTTEQDVKYEPTKEIINHDRSIAGLPEIESARDFYEKDLVILADPIQLVPDDVLPANYIISGGIWWEPESKLPNELYDISNALYISLGSTGREIPHTLIESIVQQLGVQHVISVPANMRYPRDHIPVPVHTYASLPGSKILARSSFVITQGGAGSCYQALGAGVPMGIWPAHWNHYILGKRLEELEVGIFIHPETVDQCMEYLGNNWIKFRTEAAKFKALDPAANARIAAESILKLY